MTVNVAPHPETWYTYQGHPRQYKARWLDSSGDLIQQADVSSIAVYVYDAESGAQTYTAAPAVAASVYDTAQTDTDWPYSDGYNLALTVAGSAFPNGNRLYQLEVVLTLADGNTAADAVLVHARNLFSQ